MEKSASSDSSVVVVGGGTMGSGISLSAALAGFQVTVVETNESMRNSFNTRFRRAFQFARIAGTSNTSEPERHSNISEQVRVVGHLPSAIDAGIVIECISESVRAKADLYRALEEVSAEHTIFATNTSCISIATIDRWTRRPDKMVGIHFMNPAATRNAVELIRGPLTSDMTIAKVASFLGRMGKLYNIVHDSTGFVINRVLMVSINEAIGLVERGTASAVDIDELFVRCLGHQTGPLATADLIGLDVIRDSLIVLRDQLDDRFYDPKGLLSAMVERGELGQKTGTGFHNYRGTPR